MNQKTELFGKELFEHAIRAGREQGLTTMQTAIAVIGCAAAIMIAHRLPGVSRQASVLLLQPMVRAAIDHAVKLDFREQPPAGKA